MRGKRKSEKIIKMVSKVPSQCTLQQIFVNCGTTLFFFFVFFFFYKNLSLLGAWKKRQTQAFVERLPTLDKYTFFERKTSTQCIVLVKLIFLLLFCAHKFYIHLFRRAATTFFIISPRECFVYLSTLKTDKSIFFDL